ncbi:MAG: DNA repair protein RecN, partial [Bacteroidales bacterium]|nr:DNA repair protein RecN [Bacteroidales bacterium]
SVSAAIKEAYSAIGKIASFIPGLDDIVSRMESCRIEIDDILSEIRIKEESVHLSQERLDFVDARISHIINLMRKHGVGSESELISRQHALQQQVGSVEDLEMRIDSLARRVKELEVKSSELRSELHSRRAAKADELADRLQQSIRNLEMPHAILQIKMTPLSTPDKSGGDDVRFYFSANGSAGIKELAKSASGGEISRIMLCIKALMAQHTAMPSIIFDEIDTGVSGSIADKIGGTIVKMGEQMQVFAITHLPQVASKGDAHFLVYKEFADNQASTHIKQLSHEERVKEIARMLSGAELTAEAMENAKVLMNHK